MTGGSRMRMAVRGILGLAVLGTVAHLFYTVFGLGKPGLSSFFDEWLYSTVTCAAALACILRGVAVRRERAAWLAIGGGLALWAIGDLYWNIVLADLDEIPYPSVADIFYVGGYPALFAGIALLTRSRLDRSDKALWLDGVMGGLAVAAIGSAFLYPAIQSATEGSVMTIAISLTYPLGDLLLLSFVVGAVALSGWRPDPAWGLLGIGLAVTAGADAVYLEKVATNTYVSGSWPDSLWLVGASAVAVAAWVPTIRRATVAAQIGRRRTLVLPGIFALTAVAIETWDHYHSVTDLAAWLAAATLVVVAVRMVVSLEEYLQLLRKSQFEALTDPLTGLGNRRRLMRDLERAVEPELDPGPRVFAIFDLDGFKSYNDSFGHPAGDALLARLGQKLAHAIEPHGRAYRLGGDEFCILARRDRAWPEAILEGASAALSEEGEAFFVGSSRGAVLIPDEETVAEEAMRVADHRMYAQKGTRPRSPERQTISVLLKTLQEREPALGSHLNGVAELASMLGRAIGLGGEDLDLVIRGAQLHDVGKMAVPDAILRKAAPLNDREWEVMRQHTITGERILASAPALVPVARLVRSSHERWDGDGYPDGLAGEEIPLGARLIFVCDAYEAMVEDRPWRAPKTPVEALDEMRRCAGTQLDPHLIEVFARDVFPAVIDTHGVRAQERNAARGPLAGTARS